MIRRHKKIKRYEIAEVYNLVGHECMSSTCTTHSKKDGKQINMHGYKVYTNSMRYKTFFEKGFTCAQCGRIGTHFWLECDEQNNSARAHFNLYSDDGVLMTKDHIYPKALGGANIIENMQPMCAICNSTKGKELPPEGVGAKKHDNQEYVWKGDVPYKGLKRAAESICGKKNKNLRPTIKNIRRAIREGTEYCGVHWRYGKEIL